MNTIEKAKKLLENGEIQQGRKILLDITSDDPDNTSAWLLLCGVSTRTQDWELGVLSFKHLSQLRPGSGLASSGLVQSYMNLKRHDDALEEIERFQSVADIENEEVKVVIEEHQQTIEQIKKEKGT